MLLGLDIGTKRTGVALSDGRVVSEYTTLQNDEYFLKNIQTICQEHRISTIVIGLPLAEDGHETDQTRYVQAQADQIRKVTALPVIFENELLTSSEAERLMTGMALSTSAMRQRVDQLSAKLILEQYLSERNSEP